jgi:hypothetical protein
MVARHAVVVLTLLLSFSPALAEDLDAEAARRFIVGKLFYCDFTERVRTPDTVPRPESSEPLSLDPPRDRAVH